MSQTNMQRITEGRETAAHICELHMCVINLREIALSPAVLDSKTLSDINIKLRQILHLFPLKTPTCEDYTSALCAV